MRTERETIREEFGYDPIETLSKDIWDEIPTGRIVMSDATTAVARVGAEVLRPLIVDGRPNISSRALRIFSELGKAGAVLVNEVLDVLDHPYETARWDALDGLTYHLSALTPKQVSKAIVLASDPKPLVRTKVIEFLAAVPVSKIEAAHNFIDPNDHLAEHEKGLEFLKSPVSANMTVEAISKSGMVTSCYVLASLIVAANSGKSVEIPEGIIESEEVAYVLRRMKLKARLAKIARLPPNKRRTAMKQILGRNT